MAAQTLIQLRRGTASLWTSTNPILNSGEWGYETDTGLIKIGDGLTVWNSLDYAAVTPDSLVAGSGIGLNKGALGSTLSVAVTGIPSSLITDFNSAVSQLITESSVDVETIQDIIGVSGVSGGFGISTTYDDNTGFTAINATGLALRVVAGSGLSVVESTENNNSIYTVHLSDPTIEVADITDFNEGVDDRVSSLLTPGAGIGLSYNDGDNSLQVAVTGISTSLITNFASGVSTLIENAVSTTIVGGSGIDIVYNSGTNTLNISSSLTAGSGISLTHNSGNYTIGLNDPTVQLADITDLTSDAKNFLLTPSSTNLSSLVSDETGSGSLVFANNPTLSGVTVNGNLTVGGSGLLSTNINDFHTAVRTSRLDQMSVPTSDVSFNNVKITNLAAPTSDNDAATKAYVDAARMGLDVKASVRVATTANIALSGTQTIDGVNVVADDRVLVKNQDTASENGIYVVSAGAWSRSSDANSDAKVTAGLFTFVSEGTANSDSGWVLTTNDIITLGTTSLAFAQFSGAGQITAGSGLVKTGNILDVVGTAGRIVVNADSIDLDTVTQTDNSGSAGVNFVQSVTRDAYGRVTGVTTADIRDASTSDKGVASFDSGDFTVASGVVSIKNGGVDNAQLVNSSVTIGSSLVNLGGTLTSVSGLTNVASTTFTGDLSGTATNALNIEVDVATSGTNNLVFVNGVDGNLKPVVNDKLRINLTNNELLGSSNTTPTMTLKYFIIDGGTP